MSGMTKYLVTDLGRLGLNRFIGCKACFSTSGPNSQELVKNQVFGIT